jgi:hypothetical protein
MAGSDENDEPIEAQSQSPDVSIDAVACLETERASNAVSDPQQRHRPSAL